MDPKVSTISPGLGGVTWPPFETWALEHETERALVPIVVIQLLSCRWLFVIAVTAALQASLSFTISWSLLNVLSIESVIPSNILILCGPLLLLPSVFSSIRVFSNELTFHIRWPNCWSSSFSISPSNGYSGLISLRINWFDLLAVQGTLKSLFQHHSSKASILQRSTFFMVQFSYPYTAIHIHSFDYTDLCRQKDVFVL